jgi:hypothetical protein
MWAFLVLGILVIATGLLYGVWAKADIGQPYCRPGPGGLGYGMENTFDARACMERDQDLFDRLLP